MTRHHASFAGVLAGFSLVLSHPAMAQDPVDTVTRAVKQASDGLTDAASTGVKLFEGLVGSIFNPTETQFKAAIKERRFDEALKIYEKEGAALQKNRELEGDIRTLLAHARERHAADVEPAITKVAAGRLAEAYRKDVVGFLGDVRALEEAGKTYVGRTRVLRDFDATDPLLLRSKSEQQAARDALRTNIAQVYREFPHERLEFSATVPGVTNERELFVANWEQMSQKLGSLDDASTRSLLRNTSAAWSPDAELRGKVGAEVWRKLVPAGASPVVTVKAVGEVNQYGLSRTDIKDRPRLLVLSSVPSGGEVGVRFASNHDGNLTVPNDLLSLPGAAASSPAVLVEIQETLSRRNIVDKQEVNSEYRSGTRAVPNPHYAVAQTNCQRAQAAAAAQNARNTIAPAQGWGILLQGIAEGLASAHATKVCNEFQSISPVNEEDVWSPYTYSVSEIEVTRVARGRVIALDAGRTSVETYPVQFEEKTRQKVAYGRKDSDRRSRSAITDEELEKLASKPFDLDAEKIVAALEPSGRKAHPQTALVALLAEKPAVAAPAPSQPRYAAAEVAGAAHAIQPTSARANVSQPDVSPPDVRMGSVVVVFNPKGTFGTGFYVDSNEILTNYHVVEGASTIELQSYDGQRFTGRVTRKEIGLDLAVIKVERAGTPLPISQAILKPGDTVEAIGHPKGLFYSVTRGIVSAIRQMKGTLAQGGDKALVIQTDTSINPGNSGGPLFHKDRVVGVNTIKFKGADGIGFAVHYSEMIKFLSQ